MSQRKPLLHCVTLCSLPSSAHLGCRKPYFLNVCESLPWKCIKHGHIGRLTLTSYVSLQSDCSTKILGFKNPNHLCASTVAALRETQQWSSWKCSKYTAHMLDLCQPLAEGSHLYPSLGLTSSRFWVVSRLEEVGVICWSCWCSSSGRRSTYNRDLTVKVGRWGEMVLREYRWRTTTDLITWHWEHNFIPLYQYHKWVVCILIREKAKMYMALSFVPAGIRERERPYVNNLLSPAYCNTLH